jgi:hypothetical protein
MTATQIVSEINKLAVSERILVIKNTLKGLRFQTKEKLSMKESAKLLLDDYLNDDELIAFN